MSQALILSILVLFWGMVGLLTQKRASGFLTNGFILYLGISLLLGSAASFFLAPSAWQGLFFAGGLFASTGTALILSQAWRRMEESPAKKDDPPLNFKVEINNLRDLVKVVKAAQIHLEEGSTSHQALIFLFALVVFLLLGLTK